ncbi:MAG TPA: hypothetical protein VKQ72_23590 [Aggregatilineales bacterium]|nr:hypothetical protein [Aggregatilineales bacterium]
MNTVDILANYISEVLTLPDALRTAKEGKPIAVYDASGSREWRRFSKRAIRRFTQHWRIEPDPEREGGYLFWRKL